MSITGQPQVFSTVKSSWEILDSPVPLKSELSQHLLESSSKALISVSDAINSLRPESSGYSTDQNLNLCGNQPTQDISSHISPTGTKPKFQTINPELATTESFGNKLKETQRESNSRGTATYVSSQRRRPAEDIAETIVTEFDEYVRKSHKPVRRDINVEEAGNLSIIEKTETTDFQHLVHEETNFSYSSGAHDRNTELPSQSISQVSTSNETDITSPSYRDYSEHSKVVTTTSNKGKVSHNSSVAIRHSENSKMSQAYADRQRNGGNSRNASKRGRYRNTPSVHLQSAEMLNDSSQTLNEEGNYRLDGAHDNRQTSNDSYSSSSNIRFHQRQEDERTIFNEEGERNTHTPRHTPAVDLIVSDASRSVPEVVNHPHVPANAAGEDSFPRQTMPLPEVPLPTFHPPPTIIQNGISQADLLELMSKGLGQFTTEMAIMVIEKLKPEYEALAKQVGTEVKESTATELNDLRVKLTTAEAEVESLKAERDKLKTENSKERDQMKKEFEKDRLKRVKEFEEKKELIENLQKENDQFKSLLKEKDKLLKKAEGKAKSEEQKRIKFEEETGKKQKELQKELDKIKGELLVQKSKKRLQISSAQSKKDCLGKLNSQHGYPKQFNGHKPIQYDEGDD